MDREDNVLEYIEAHPLCTKTEVKNSMDMATPTTDKILKKLIQVDKKITCVIDSVNPRIHHLIVNNENKMLMANLLLKKAEEQLKKEMYTRVELTSGEMLAFPLTFPLTNGTGVKNLVATARALTKY